MSKVNTKFHAMTDGEMITLIFRNVFNITPDVDVVLKRMEEQINLLLDQYRQQLKEKVDGKFNERRKEIGKLIEKWDYSEDNARMREIEILESDILNLLESE